MGGYGAVAAEDLLERFGYSASEDWQPRPEAEWGYEDALTADIQELANSIRARVVRLTYEAPQDLSGPISRIFVRDRNQRLFVTNFNMLAPAFIHRSGATPYWAVFNDRKSLTELEGFLSAHGPFEQVDSLLFQNGVQAEGQATASDWLDVLSAHACSARLLGLLPDQNPRDFAAFDRYRRVLRKTEGDLEEPMRSDLELNEVLDHLVLREGIGSIL